MNNAVKYIRNRLGSASRRWDPFLSVYYLTYGCDFRCSYCSDGKGRPYHLLPDPAPDAETAKRIIGRIRQYADYLVITGGEPLGHPDLGEVIRHAGRCRFRELVVTTNGHDLDRWMEPIASSIDTLVVSVDTLDGGKADSLYGRGEGTFSRIMANLSLAASLPGRRFGIVLSAVATPGNLPDLYEVYEFSKRNGFTFAAAPQLDGVRAVEELSGNEEYRRLFDFLVREKERGGRIFGSPLYLEHLRDLRGFSCRPFTMLVVNPAGNVYYPCLEIGHLAGNLLEETSLHALRAKGLRAHGPPPSCGVQCHSACALGFGLLFSHPSSALREAWIHARTRLLERCGSSGMSPAPVTTPGRTGSARRRA